MPKNPTLSTSSVIILSLFLAFVILEQISGITGSIVESSTTNPLKGNWITTTYGLTFYVDISDTTFIVRKFPFIKKTFSYNISGDNITTTDQETGEVKTTTFKQQDKDTITAPFNSENIILTRIKQ